MPTFTEKIIELTQSVAPHSVDQPLLPSSVRQLLARADLMPDLTVEQKFDSSRCPFPPAEKESESNLKFLRFFTSIMKQNFSNLPWWLDEGGLIGSARAGAMVNADDDFDFFSLLPKQYAPCRSDSLTCEPEEFDRMIHSFLMIFWNSGACINKFEPNFSKFVSRRRLMYSFQLHKPNSEINCFEEGKPFAHMHLGIFNEEGKLQTNIWARHTTHPIDEIPLHVVLPVRRCRVGNADAPCPNNVTEYLSIRNRGEYRKRSSDGSCLLVRSKWGIARKRAAVDKVRLLDSCGYNSLFDLVPAFVSSGYQSC